VKAREKVNAEFGIPSDAVLIGMAANMRRIKGADLLLKALMQLPKNVHGLFIGSVLDSEISILASDPKLSDRVHLTGFRKDAIEMIAALDINVAPSRGREGLTKSVIEASALKIPSICSNAGGLPETQPAGNHETIFSNGDVTRLKELLHTLIGNSELRKQLGSSSQKHTRENLSVEITIKRTETIYHEITSKKHKRF
jgi:glycosyltransferase involved in cell wall biosynthesis